MPAQKMTGDPLQDAINGLNKDIEANTVYYLGDSHHLRVDVIPTGAPSLDLALGVGGIPYGRITEIYGPEASGKTTLCQHVIANVQSAGGIAAFIDAENALDPSYAQRCGVDIDRLIFTQPDCGEDALMIVDRLVRSGKVRLIVIDSVAALVPRAELDGDMGDAHMGLQARLMGQGMRKLAGIVRKSQCAVMFTNQLRSKIGVIFGSPETTTGGNALKFTASIRLDIRRVESIKQGNDVIGNHVKVKVAKNKVAPPYKLAEFNIFFNDGIDYYGSLIEAAVLSELVTKKGGGWYSYGDVDLGHGMDTTREFLKNNQDVTQLIDGQLREYIEQHCDPDPHTERSLADI